MNEQIIAIQYKPQMKHKKVVLLQEKEYKSSGEYVFDNDIAVSAFMRNVIKIDKNTVEYAYMLALNTKGRLLGLFEISKGSIDLSAMSPRDIILNAVLINSSNIIMVHNHPSGDSKPSITDIETTKSLNKGLALCGLKLLDHIIIGESTSYSFKKESNIL